MVLSVAFSVNLIRLGACEILHIEIYIGIIVYKTGEHVVFIFLILIMNGMSNTIYNLE